MRSWTWSGHAGRCRAWWTPGLPLLLDHGWRGPGGRAGEPEKAHVHLRTSGRPGDGPMRGQALFSLGLKSEHRDDSPLPLPRQQRRGLWCSSPQVTRGFPRFQTWDTGPSRPQPGLLVRASPLLLNIMGELAGLVLGPLLAVTGKGPRPLLRCPSPYFSKHKWPIELMLHRKKFLFSR